MEYLRQGQESKTPESPDESPLSNVDSDGCVTHGCVPAIVICAIIFGGRFAHDHIGPIVSKTGDLLDRNRSWLETCVNVKHLPEWLIISGSCSSEKSEDLED